MHWLQPLLSSLILTIFFYASYGYLQQSGIHYEFQTLFSKLGFLITFVIDVTILALVSFVSSFSPFLSIR